MLFALLPPRVLSWSNDRGSISLRELAFHLRLQEFPGQKNLPCLDLIAEWSEPASLENSLRITLKVSREFVESSLGFERIWKFLQEPVKRSKDLGSTVFLHQLLKNDACANVLMETKTNRVFEAIVYFRNCVIHIHKFVLKHCILRMQRSKTRHCDGILGCESR